MAYIENIERIFLDEIREKRKIGNGSFHRRGKGVKHNVNGALRTPYHFMKEKDRKKLSGEVVVTFMYETILPKDEFLLKSIEVQKLMLSRWRELYDNQTIRKQMGASNSYLFKLVDSLELPKKIRTPSKPQTIRKGKVVAAKPTEETLPEKPSTPQVVSEPRTLLITRGLHLEYNGEYNADELNRIFTKLQLITDGEENKFNLSISLSERT